MWAGKHIYKVTDERKIDGAIIWRPLGWDEGLAGTYIISLPATDSYGPIHVMVHHKSVQLVRYCIQVFALIVTHCIQLNYSECSIHNLLIEFCAYLEF